MNKIYTIIVILTFGLIGYLLYDKYTHVSVIVKFDELEPLEKQMNVYYKGFKVGRTVKIYPDRNYQNTFIEMRLFPYNINLPANITAKIKRTKTAAYINILVPEEPSVKRISNRQIIKGTSTRDLNSLINDSFGDDGFDVIIDDATNLMETANVTVKNLGDIFLQVNEIITEIRGDINLAADNLAKTTTNLEKMSASLNKSLDEKTMKNSIDNIEETTQNILKITESLNDISVDIDTKTMPIVNSVLCETNSTVKNVNEISNGIKNTLKKKRGLGKVLFGRPISDDNE